MSKRRNSTLKVLYLLTAGSLGLVACSSDSGQIITLNVEPEVTIRLPEGLTSDAIQDLQSIIPRVTLSNGDTVSVTQRVGNNWRGTVNVVAGRDYTATVVWNENYYGQPLRLATLEQQLSISDIGNVTVLASTDYDTRIDTDNDGVFNLRERQDGTNPFDGDNFIASSVGIAAPNIRDITGVDAPMVVDVMIPRIAAENAPKIDGRALTSNNGEWLGDEWAAAAEHDHRGTELLFDKRRFTTTDELDDGRPQYRWAAMHDGAWLYVLVLGDNGGQSQRSTGYAPVKNEQVEIVIAGDGSPQAFYDEKDAYHALPLPPADDEWRSGNAAKVARTGHKRTPLIMEFATSTGNRPDGLPHPRFEQNVIEMRIAVASAGIDPDSPFAIEMTIRDRSDDSYGALESARSRENRSSSNSDRDVRRRDSTYRGTAKLE